VVSPHLSPPPAYTGGKKGRSRLFRSDDEAGLDQEKSSEDNLDPDAGTSRFQKRKLDDDDDDDDDFMMEELRSSTTRVEPAQK